MRPKAIHQHWLHVESVWIDALHEYGLYTWQMYMNDHLDYDDCENYESFSTPIDQQWHISIDELDNIDWVDDILDAED